MIALKISGICRVGVTCDRAFKARTFLRIFFVAGLFAVLAGSKAFGESVLYVDANATGQVHDGTNWCQAYIHLQDALSEARASASAVTEIRVADGVYKPDKGADATAGDREATFQLINGVALRGGYAGCGAPDSDKHDIALYETVLSGDLNGDDGFDFTNYDENARHVVTTTWAGGTTTLDGFTVVSGNADGTFSYAGAGGGMLNMGGTPTVRACTFRANAALYRGGGLATFGTGTPTIAQCHFTQNRTAYDSAPGWDRHYTVGGAGVFSEEGDPVIRDCTFSMNGSGAWGGGFLSSKGAPALSCCEFTGNIAYHGGGGLRLYAGGDTSISNCTFHDNQAIGSVESTRGGGISCQYALSIKVEGSVFSKNSADLGGGLYSLQTPTVVLDSIILDHTGIEAGAGFLILASNATFVNCEFENNSATRDGGGLFVQTTNGSLTDCRFNRNQARNSGGGMFSFSNGPMELVQCVFHDNYGNAGGGLYAHGPLVLMASSFLDNRAHNGAGVYLDGPDAELSNCAMIWNRAYAYGGAVSNPRGLLRITNCTVAHNEAWGLGGGIITGLGATLSNSILWGNTAGPSDAPFTDEWAQIEGGRFTPIHHSCIQGWTGAWGGAGNIGKDPLFVDADGPDDLAGTGDDNVRLSSDSPAINAGDPAFVAELGQVDLDGHARVLCGRIDMGAYEFGIGDYDCNREVELTDFTAWDGCTTGPEHGPFKEGCEAFDFDADGDVDLQDYAGFATVYTRQ